MRGSDKASVAYRVASGIKDVPVVEGRSEIGAVYDVKKLRAKLDVERIRDTLDAIILQQRKIEIDESRPDQSIASQVAAQIKAP